MFYRTQIEDHIRVPPADFGAKLEESVIRNIKKKYDGFIHKDIGIVIDVPGVNEIGE
jgi:DNA-directed RNA polymerase subunit E'/Rpb7